jgi:FkbM family methyltransferase
VPTVEHIEAIRRLLPKTLIDVGANKGQFSLMARVLFPDLEIHAFEPLGSEREKFKMVIRQPVNLYPTALGQVSGVTKFFIASRADSSSLLQLGQMQRAAYGIETKMSTIVPLARLPDLVNVANLRRPILLKLDVQGAEIEVLKGAESCLLLIDMIYCEVSFVELYKGQPLASEIVSYLAARDFSLRGVFNQSVTRNVGATQADFLFTRNAYSPNSTF